MIGAENQHLYGSRIQVRSRSRDTRSYYSILARDPTTGELGVAVQRAERMTEVTEGTGEIVAVDAATGEIQWTHETDAVPFGAATVVNDLVVASTFEGTIFALDRNSGEEVRRAQLAVPLIAWPAVVDDTIIIGAGASQNAQLVAFRLGAPQATPAATPVS